ncbi:33279_t:CDS:2, partial [Gigaspora margarita]
MPLFKRKLSSNNLFIEQALIQEKVSLVSNIDYIDSIDSDSDVNDQNESHFFSVIWSGNSKSLTCSFSELPHWLQDNVDILKGASACFPVLHAVILYGLRLCNDVISLQWMIITGAIYLIGAVFYGY